MKHIYRFFLLLLILSAISCTESRQPLPLDEQPPAVVSRPAMSEYAKPVVLLLYPNQQRADSLKKAWGTEEYYSRLEETAAYYKALRSRLDNSGISVVTSEEIRFRFIQGNGAIVETDLSRIGSPWQVLIFDGTHSPQLVSPENAMSALEDIFSQTIPQNEPSKKSGKKKLLKSQAIHSEEKTIEHTSPILPVWPRDKEIIIRLLIPPGETAPTDRDETSGIRIINSYISPARQFWLMFDNDIFSNTDRYYTNGVVLGITAPGLVNLPLNFLMVSPRRNNVVSASLSLHHAMFTPFTTKTAPTLENDRPYASTLFFRYSQTSDDALSGLRISSSIDAGVIGDAALGRYFQSSVHAVVPTNDEPLGWETQIKNDLVLNYALTLQKQLYKAGLTEIYAQGSANAGTLHTRVGVGLEAVAGVFSPVITPLPYTYEELQKSRQKLQFGLKGGFDFRIIGYDATLQGGVFNNSNTFALKPEEIERMVAHVHLGLFVRYKKMGINLTQFYLSPEFKEGKQHLWGQIALEYGW